MYFKVLSPHDSLENVEPLYYLSMFFSQHSEFMHTFKNGILVDKDSLFGRMAL